MRLNRLNAIILNVGITAATVFHPPSALAGGTQYWELQGQANYLRGEAQGISISREGRIMLSPRFDETFNTSQAFVWSIATDRQGNIYLGTGHEGKLFKVETNGTGKLLFDAEELDVTALATDDDGNLYAGTSPNGKVYRITPQGQSSVFFDPEDTYIWALIHHSGSLYVGTGGKGKVYTVAKTGTARVLADTKETNITSMSLDTKGDLIVGTDPSGLVLRITPQGNQFAIHDSSAREIHDLVVTNDGTMYALGISQRGEPQPATLQAPTPSPQPSVVSSTGNVTVTITSSDLTSQSLISDPDTQSFNSAVYRISPAGAVETLWTTTSFSSFCLALDRQGNLLVGTNDKGRVYLLDERGNTTLLAQSSEGQISNLMPLGQSILATTSNLGKLFRLGAEQVAQGTYSSPVFDTRFVSQWGTVVWRNQTGTVEVQTRTGNTEMPDDTWSPWSASYTNGGKITNPPARFIQFRLTLKPAGSDRVGAQIEGVRVAYLPQNIKPSITSLEVMQSGVALQEVPQQPVDPGILSSGLDPSLFGFSSSIPPRRVFQRGVRSLQWTAQDPNGDQLVSSIHYRSATENAWKQLAANLSSNYYTIDADALPDGHYAFKVVVSDSPANPEGRALQDERITDPVLIDNTTPLVRPSPPRTNGRRVEIDFSVEDATSNISRTEFSIDGGRWQLIFPLDGIADSPSERFTVKADFTSPGEHTITLRAYDGNTNVGSSKVTITIQ